jgi:hypothetical protein
VDATGADGVAWIGDRLSAERMSFDIVVIDGLFRTALASVALDVLGERGAVVCDNAERYETREAFLEAGLSRVDFIGHAPGVILPHVTAIFFRPGCFLFDPACRLSVSAGGGARVS